MNTVVKASILHNIAKTSVKSLKTINLFARALSTKTDSKHEYKGGFIKVGHWAQISKQFNEDDVSEKRDFFFY